MAKVYLEDSELTNIGNAIRGKNGETTKYLPSEMPAAIDAIQGGGGKVTATGDISCLMGYDYGTSYPYGNEFLRNNFSEVFNPDFVEITNGRYAFMYGNDDERIMNAINYLRSINFKDATANMMFQDCYMPKSVPKLTGTLRTVDSMFNHVYANIPKPDYSELQLKIESTNYPPSMFCYCTYWDCGDLFKGVTMTASTPYTNKTLGFNSGVTHLCTVEEMYLPRLKFNETFAITPYSSKTAYICQACPRLKKVDFQSGNDTWLLTGTGTWDFTRAFGYGKSIWDADYINADELYPPEKEVTVSNPWTPEKEAEGGYWTQELGLSRMGRTAVIEMFKTLPTLSEATITLIFRGDSGKYYTGGGINALLPADIAIATEKGFTVTLK